jgi:hypothetical protein
MPDLRVINAEPQGAEIFEAITEAMDLAADSQLSSVALCYVYRDGTVSWRWSHAPNSSAMLGSMARMQADFIRHLDD